MKIRQRLQDFFAYHEVAWEIFMIVLAIVFVAIDIVTLAVGFPPNVLAILGIIDWTINGIFVVEFIVRLIIAPRWFPHLKTHWLDMVAVLPSIHWLRLTRLVYLVRILRFARLARVCSSLDRLEFNLNSFFQLNGMAWILLTLTGIMLSSSALFYFFEHPVNDKVVTYWDALYAALVIWTTPGYGDILPVTSVGRIFGLVIIISGLLTWGVLIANLAAFLATRSRMEKFSDPAIADLHNKLIRIDEMSKLELLTFRSAINAVIESKIEENEDVEGD